VLAGIARLHGARVIGHVHGAWFDRILVRGGMTEALVRSCLRLFNALLMLGTPWKQMVEGYGYRGHVFVVPSTLQGGLFEAGIQFQRNYATAEPLGLFVGQVGERKGVFELLEAQHRLKERGKSARMVFVGPPEGEGDWKALMKRRAELDVEDVSDFIGALQGDALHQMYRRADYFVLPSHSEGLPVVFFEAGVFGMPVIGTPVGAVTDLLKDNDNALLVRPGNIEELVTAIARLRDKAEDRERLGSALREAIAPYHPDVVCARIAEAIAVTLTREAV
jgi:glycosyltransferase involved in cell wall biosynthesis